MNGVVILGAGLAGLGCATKLPGQRVFEDSAHPGGHAYAHRIGDVFFDQGAHICHSKDKIWLDLIYKSADDVEQILKARVANNWNGQWVTYPVQNHLHELDLDVKTRALIDLVNAHIEYKDQEPSNYHEWAVYQYGEFITEQFYKKYTTKYWRVPMSELSLDWLSGRLLPSQFERIVAGAFSDQEENQSKFIMFHYPAEGGFYRFFKNQYNDIPIQFNKKAVKIDTKRNCVTFDDGQLEYYEALANSIPLPNLIDMIHDVPGNVLAARSYLRSTRLLCVNILINREHLTPYHWFYVYDSNKNISRVSIPSNLAPKSVPAGVTAVQAEIFRRNDENFDITSSVKRTLNELAEILHFDPATEVREITPVHVPYAYIISDHHRAQAVATISSWLREHSIFNMGLFGGWQFMWSDAAYQSGVIAANMIRNRLHII